MARRKTPPPVKLPTAWPDIEPDHKYNRDGEFIVSPPAPKRLSEFISHDGAEDEDERVEIPQLPKEDAIVFTAANKQQLAAVLRELTSRKKEALRLYVPSPNQEAFHRSRARKKLAVGGNRGGKTLVAATEIGRALTNSDPYDKYPHRPLRCIFVGKDLLHCSKVMYRKLFKPGAIAIIKDLDTGKWRSFSPATDLERETQCVDASPIIPPRFVKSISWEDKREEVARSVALVNGHTGTFFSGEGEPPQGWDVDIIWLDEEVGHPKWYTEMVPRLVDRGGILIWSFTPQIGSPVAYDLMNIADKTADDPNAPIQKFFFNIDTNLYISEARRQAFKDDFADDEEEYRVRVEGKSALEGQRVYPEFAPHGIHKCAVFPIPSDWTRYIFVDPGRQVAAALFLAVPPPDNEYAKHEAIVYDEIYLKKANAITFAQKVKQHVVESWIQDWLIDGHMARTTEIGSGIDVETQYRNAFLENGLGANGFGNFIWSSDDLDGGILSLKSKLQLVSGVPKWLFMTENLRWFCWEMGRYANKKITRVNIITDKPEKRHDHLCDCGRYASQHRLKYVAPPSKKKKKAGASWAEKYIKAKKARAHKESPSGGAIAMF